MPESTHLLSISLCRRYLGEQEHLKRSEEEQRQELEQARQYKEDVAQATTLIQEIAQNVQKAAHTQIASIVTRCLDAVFGSGEYAFKVIFEPKRNKTEANLLLERNGHDIDPLEADAGGVVDVISFALRLACLLLSRPARRKLLVLDEPFRMLSVEFRPQIRGLLEAISEEFGVQIVLVTHAREIVCGKVLEFS